VAQKKRYTGFLPLMSALNVTDRPERVVRLKSGISSPILYACAVVAMIRRITVNRAVFLMLETSSHLLDLSHLLILKT